MIQFHPWLGVGDGSFVELVRVTYDVQIFMGIDPCLHAPGTCPVGPTVVNSLARPSPYHNRYRLFL
jgi:hypothetical protein